MSASAERRSSSDVVLRTAQRRDRNDAAELLARAFAHDPLIAAATRSVREPHGARSAIFRASISGTLLAGGELVLAERRGDLIGAALIADPSSGTLARAARASTARLVSGARFLTLARRLAPGALTLLNSADQASRRLAPPHPHHVLVAVGVDAAARGLGVGRLLVDHAVQRARTDSLSWGVRLETENPQNVDRYARWGFSQLGVVSIGTVDVHVMGRSTHHDTAHEEGQ